MASKWKYEIITYWSAEDQAYVAEIPELPGCAADGATYKEVLSNAEVVIREWIETARELGRPIPEPKRASVVAHIDTQPGNTGLQLTVLRAQPTLAVVKRQRKSNLRKVEKVICLVKAIDSQGVPVLLNYMSPDWRMSLFPNINPPERQEDDFPTITSLFAERIGSRRDCIRIISLRSDLGAPSNCLLRADRPWSVRRRQSIRLFHQPCA